MKTTIHHTQKTKHILTLSVVLATKNEEVNLGRTLSSIKDIADEIIVFDEFSEDKTREIAKEKGAKVYKYQHKTNFHETKQKAIEKAKGDWILQLDADEVVTPELAEEIKEVINADPEDLQHRAISHSDLPLSFPRRRESKNRFPIKLGMTVKKTRLFTKYQKLIEQRDGKVGENSGEVVAFFIPRKNIFLGAPMVHGGVYPDAVIRLFKKGKARLPGKSVHELLEVDGQVGWLFNDLLHYDSPTFERYFARWNRYTDLIADDYKIKFKNKTSYLDLFYYSTIKPAYEFLNLYLRHKGILDGFRGLVWSLFSALRFPVSYFKYYSNFKNSTKPS